MRRRGKRYHPPTIGVSREISREALSCEARATADVMRARHARLLEARLRRAPRINVEALSLELGGAA